jgi:hypothetical protein
VTPDERAFWDAAYIHYVAAVVSDPQTLDFTADNAEACAEKADLMLTERRKRTSISVPA